MLIYQLRHDKLRVTNEKVDGKCTHLCIDIDKVRNNGTKITTALFLSDRAKG